MSNCNACPVICDFRDRQIDSIVHAARYSENMQAIQGSLGRLARGAEDLQRRATYELDGDAHAGDVADSMREVQAYIAATPEEGSKRDNERTYTNLAISLEMSRKNAVHTIEICDDRGPVKVLGWVLCRNDALSLWRRLRAARRVNKPQ